MLKKLYLKFGESDKVYKRFITFVIGILLIGMFIIVYGSFEKINSYKDSFGNIDILFCILYIAASSILYIYFKKGVSSEIILIGIIILGLLLRSLYAFSIDSIPVSDFSVMYDVAGCVLHGDYSSFWGTGYMARFPHITIPTLYFAVIRYISPYPLITIKAVNVIASTCNIFIIYNIVKELFMGKGKAIIAGMMTALYPPLILYTAVFTTENLSIPFMLLSIYMFILFVKNDKKFKYLILSALFLFIGHLFRMVGQILLIAFILYLIVSYKEKIKKKVLASAIVVGIFLTLLISTSSLLNYTGITQYSLWKGSETNLTNIVKGLNIENEGHWNEEDSEIPERCDFDYEEMVRECKRIIKDRLSNTPKGELLKFFVNKYRSQWCAGDFSGAYWAEHSLEERDIGLEYSNNGIWFGQLFFVILIILSYIGVLNINEVKRNRPISLIYYIFCGYSVLYLVSENQERYGFIVCWLFIIMASVGIDLLEKIRFSIKADNLKNDKSLEK